MININLLPWREEIRKINQQKFMAALTVSVVAAVFITMVYYVSVANKISYQNQRNQFITQQIAQSEQQIAHYKSLDNEKTLLVKNLHLIQSMHNSRFEVVDILDELAKLVPNNVYLTRVEQNGDRLTLEGTAKSNANITLLMKSIEASKWLSTPVLNEIKVSKDYASRHFELITLQRDSQFLGDKHVVETK